MSQQAGELKFACGKQDVNYSQEHKAGRYQHKLITIFTTYPYLRKS